jgi:hypothetical protein
MITREPIKRSPFLTGVTNELPFVLADGAEDSACALSSNCVPHWIQMKFSTA